MNYKLAKKLKEAGFPHNFDYNDHEMNVPTLEELIEACGDDLTALIQGFNKIGWEATYLLGGENPHHDAYVKGEGKSPEEAVANLWLELHKTINK